MRGRLQKWRCVWNCIDSPSQQLRLLHEGPDTVEELLKRHLVKNNNENELENRRQLTSTRREALSLYRDILRATRVTKSYTRFLHFKWHKILHAQVDQFKRD
ncbi:hypothetical protein JHK84_041212 [Glycine max]|nr:hypothetical protein JHK84_041212 [Glycine max]